MGIICDVIVFIEWYIEVDFYQCFFVFEFELYRVGIQVIK